MHKQTTTTWLTENYQ